jgi:hypothetical protein
MACCGEQRARQKEMGVQPLPGFVRLRFAGVGRVRLSGVPSGRQYIFSQAEPIHEVAAQDVESIVRTGLFRPTS